MKERIEALGSALVGEQPTVRSLMVLLLETDRIALVPQIALAFGDLVDRREGIAKARITTAVPLKDGEQRELVSRLESESKRKLRATFAVDPTLIGGAKVQIGDHLIDSSVRAKLVALGRQLAS
jgi:F-type H+-transporting ATPase subunit delta